MNYAKLPTFMYKRRCFFFTVVTHDRFPIFSNVENIRTFRKITDEVRHILPFKEIACVVLHDHIHSIWKLPEGEQNFSKRWGIIKSRFTKHSRFICAHHHNQQIWQNRFWEHEIRDINDLNNHIDYLHYNPVKHGYVDKVSDWKYSSFHRFVNNGYYDIDWGDNVVFSGMDQYGE